MEDACLNFVDRQQSLQPHAHQDAPALAWANKDAAVFAIVHRDLATEVQDVQVTVLQP